MAVRPILVIPDPRLRQTAAEVEAVDDEIRSLVDDMFETMYDAPNGIGLAAPQIGVLKRVVVMDLVKDPEEEGLEAEPRVFINPEITSVGEALDTHEEGCLSIPEYYGEVTRPDRCTVEFLDLEGNRQSLDCEDTLAFAVQHEVDHLNGKLVIDFLSRLKRDMIVRKYAKQARHAG